MDINTLRGLATIFALFAFLAVTLWAFSKRKKQDFDTAARIPLEDDGIADNQKASSVQGHNKKKHKIKKPSAHSHKDNHTGIPS
ncbi:hypothetical protein CI610_00847 [invertebrate metagenome]|uniref:Cbb3-type cytochrome oxidase component FixQ n=1 Tax=invertebrate metagenome TaxID=1711999 RepID=A0A2H9TAE8_9ZZZZ